MSGISYPQATASNYTHRAKILSKGGEDIKFQAAIWDVCKNDILFFINSFCWIYEPRPEALRKLGMRSAHLPFITWDFQDDYILWMKNHIDNQKDALTEKSRDMGATWCALAVVLHYWLFGDPGNDFLVGSRKEEYVDRLGQMDALFPKLRFMLYKLPGWMQPLGFDRKKHDNYMRLKNPENGNTIKGESNNPYFGTSGRYTAVLLDEFAKWDNTDESAWQSLSDTSLCRLPLSSANGSTNMFYRLVTHKIGNIDVKTLRWNIHPLKDDRWYEAEKARRTPSDLAAEVDIDYSKSVSNKAYESFDRHIHCAEPWPIWDPLKPINLECDFNVSPMSWAISQDNKDVTEYIDELVVHSTITERVITEFCTRYANQRHKLVYIYGDQTGKRRGTRSHQSDYDIIRKILRQHGWEVVEQIPRSNPPVGESLSAMNKALSDWEEMLYRHKEDERGLLSREVIGKKYPGSFKEWIPVRGKSHIRINPQKCPQLVESFEQTRRKDDGIDKTDNIEHITDGPRYRVAYKSPIQPIKIGAAKW